MDNDELHVREIPTEELRWIRTLHTYIRIGALQPVRSFMKKFSPEERANLTKQKVEFDLDPALVVAIRCNSPNSMEILKFLVGECNADFEERVLRRAYDYTTSATLDDHASSPSRHISPLEIAVRRNRSDVVEYLAQIGADVSKLAMDGNTILVACETGSVKSVQILAVHGADLSTACSAGITCLMKAVENVDLCRFIIDKGVDVNAKDRDGDTALHFAARSNLCSTVVVELLLQKGANPRCKNKFGDDPLVEACIRGSEMIAKYFTETVFMDVKRQIESLQLLGASEFCHTHRTENAMSPWRRAIILSTDHGFQSEKATFATPIGVAVEATSLSEIEDLCQDNAQVALQSIVLIYKILGPRHDKFLEAIYAAALICDRDGSHDQCLSLLVFGYRMSRKSDRDFHQRCLGLRRIEDQTKTMIYRKLDRNSITYTSSPCYQTIRDLMEAITEEETKGTEITDTKSRLKLIIHCICLMLFIDCTQHEKVEFEKLLRFGIRKGLKSMDGRTLMMMALDFRHTLSYDISCSPVDSPRVKIQAMLLQCGADVDETDRNGNNIVHHMLKILHNLPSSDIAYHLADMYIKHGLHLDSRNNERKETTSCLRSLGIEVTPPINLMCLASRAIRRFNVPYVGIIPKILVDFVEMH